MLPAALAAGGMVALWRRCRQREARDESPRVKKQDLSGGGVAVSASAARRSPARPLALPPPLPLPPLPRPAASLTVLDLSGLGLTSVDALFPAGTTKPLYPRLEVLDLGRNALAHLPESLAAAAPRLVRLNVQGNPGLTHLPDCLGSLSRLRVLGAARCGLVELPASIGGCGALEELYVTGNALSTFPPSLAACGRLQKVQASFNALVDLGGLATPLPSLEMLRVACCGLAAFPASLAAAPRLAWISLAGNPAAAAPPPLPSTTPIVPARDVTPGAPLGAGASGDVCVASLRPRGDLPRAAALKTFRGDVGPDGAAADEVAVSKAVGCGGHPALSSVLAVVKAKGKGKGRGAPPPALLLALVRGSPLADRPNGAPLLRPHWRAGARLAPAAALRLAASLAGGLAHLHAKGLAHGDFYAHNVLAHDLGNDGNDDGNGQAGGVEAPPSPAVLVDFGAAFAYHLDAPPASCPAWAFQAFEARAFGLFLAQLAAHGLSSGGDEGGGGGGGFVARASASRALLRAAKACTRPDPSSRPSLAEVERDLLAAAERVRDDKK